MACRDGLPSQEFGEKPVARLQDGRIAAATPEGLVLFDPAVVHPATDDSHAGHRIGQRAPR